MGDIGLGHDGSGVVDPGDDDRGRSHEPWRGMHRFDDDHEELVDCLLADVLEGLELRLAFEAWADRRAR